MTSHTHPDSLIEQENTRTEQQFIHSLRKAIDNNELRLHYQPRYDCLSREITMFEALVRWQRPHVGLLYPDVFLPLAEKHDLIFNVSLWVFQQACTDLKWMRQHIDSRCRLSINLSLRECESLYHAQKLYDICTANGLELSDFEFEITENVCPKDPRKVRSFCETLANLGASFSLDDFGTSYSPLSNIYHLPVTAIKIDRSFVNNIGDDYILHILVSNMISLAKDLNIISVAEGVENEQQAEILTSMGCDELQGSYICEPKRLPALHLSLPALHTDSLRIH